MSDGVHDVQLRRYLVLQDFLPLGRPSQTRMPWNSGFAGHRSRFQVPTCRTRISGKRPEDELRNPPADPERLPFSKNAVLVLLCDPNITDLSFVDLPGLIQNERTEVIDVVRDLACIKSENTLILVTIPMSGKYFITSARFTSPDTLWLLYCFLWSWTRHFRQLLAEKDGADASCRSRSVFCGDTVGRDLPPIRKKKKPGPLKGMLRVPAWGVCGDPKANTFAQVSRCRRKECKTRELRFRWVICISVRRLTATKLGHPRCIFVFLAIICCAGIPGPRS
ncbi:hypothetical protein C8R47DRAFT_1321067 [Mycena vitilis]|nr:hypothetical protein C8R47DRAFT_1321067 [Mycena vitilis]